MNTKPVARDGKLIAAVIAAVDEYISGTNDLEATYQPSMSRWKLSSISGTSQYNRARNWNGLDTPIAQIPFPQHKI